VGLSIQIRREGVRGNLLFRGLRHGRSLRR
jgi:hypothetical protein